VTRTPLSRSKSQRSR